MANGVKFLHADNEESDHPARRRRLIWFFVGRTCQKNHITKTHLFKYIENFTSKQWKFSDEKSDIFYISAQNIDCGYWLEPPRRGGSNEYPKSMFLSRNKKNNVYPCKPQFYNIKVGFKGGQNYIGMFLWWCTFSHSVALITLNVEFQRSKQTAMREPSRTCNLILIFYIQHKCLVWLMFVLLRENS